MIDNIYRIFSSSKRHWLFWPFFWLILLIAVFTFFFSDNGYFAYQNKSAEKKEVARQLVALQKQKKEISKKIKDLENDEVAFQKFTKKLLLFKERVHVLKFIEPLQKKSDLKKMQFDLVQLQRYFAIAGSLSLLLITLMAWKIKGPAIAENAGE